jgi:integral membrane protein (TIGR01906 family)
MKKVLSVGMATIASILLIVILVFTSIGLVLNDQTFINNEFTKLAISEKMGINNTDLVRSMTKLVDYMEGDEDDISVEVTLNGEQVEMFSYPQEAEHMADVRQIYMTIASYRDISVLAMLILFLFAAVVDFRRAPQRLSQGYLSGSFVMLLIFGFLGTWAALDFSNFWTFFHEALFWNDLWLFDSTESRMINMLPEDFFADIIGRIGLYAGAVIAALIVLSVLALVLSSDAHKRRLAIIQARSKAKKTAAEARKKAKKEARETAEQEKRLAEKKARIAAAKAKKQQRLESERKAAQQEQLLQERREKKRAEAEAEAAAPQRKSPAKTAAKAPAKTKRPAQKATAPRKPKPKKENIEDDTGFLDD